MTIGTKSTLNLAPSVGGALVGQLTDNGRLCVGDCESILITD